MAIAAIGLGQFQRFLSCDLGIRLHIKEFLEMSPIQKKRKSCPMSLRLGPCSTSINSQISS